MLFWSFSSSLVKIILGLPWDGEIRDNVRWNLRERDALGKWPMSLVERSSLSRRFVFFFIVSSQYMFVSNIEMNYLQSGLV